MKKPLLIIFVLLMAFPYSGIAQMEKGSWMLRGKFGLDYEKNRTDINSTLPNYPNQPDIIESLPSIMFSPGIGFLLPKIPSWAWRERMEEFGGNIPVPYREPPNPSPIHSVSDCLRENLFPSVTRFPFIWK